MQQFGTLDKVLLGEKCGEKEIKDSVESMELFGETSKFSISEFVLHKYNGVVKVPLYFYKEPENFRWVITPIIFVIL